MEVAVVVLESVVVVVVFEIVVVDVLVFAVVVAWCGLVGGRCD